MVKFSNYINLLNYIYILLRKKVFKKFLPAQTLKALCHNIKVTCYYSEFKLKTDVTNVDIVHVASVGNIVN